MTKEQMLKLIKLAEANGIDSMLIAVAFEIAMDMCDDPTIIERYGTINMDRMRELKKVYH